MGTTLTGLTPATTYDALIKVGDNGPLSATAKYLSDGLGNDSKLSLSTSGVGIGTTSILGDFSINNASEMSAYFFVGGTRYAGLYTDGSIFSINSYNSAALTFSTSTGTSFAERMRITSAGNVGIGTSSPQGPLEVYKSNSGGLGGHIILNNVGTAVGDETAVLFNDSGIGSVSSIRAAISSSVEGSPYYGDLKFKTGSSDYASLNTRMIITGAGNVGIGTSSPSRPLTVVSTQWDNSTGAGAIFSNSNSVGAGITLQPSASVVTNGSNGWALYAGGPSADIGDGNLGFWAHGTNDARMVIQRGGNVGIGTGSPSTRLQVVGGGQTTSIANAATTSTSRFDVANPSISLGIGYVGTDIPMLQSFNNGTNGATNLTINPFGGSVGIGTSSPAQALDVNGSIRSVGGSYDPTTSAWINAAFATKVASSPYGGGFSLIDGTSGWTQYSVGSGATLVFAQGATSGGTTERMKLDSSGNLSLPTGNIALSGAGGIYFDSGASKYLDDYEVGTFTPVFRGATSAGSYTFSLGGGSYTKIGNQVTVWITLIDIAESSAGSGNWQISGLPFTSANTFNLARNATACWIRSSAAARNNILCGVGNNASTIFFIYDANGSGAASDFTIASDFLTNMDIGLQVTYYV